MSMYLTEFENYLRVEKGCSEHTINAYMGDVSGFFQFIQIDLNIESVSEVNHHTIRKWLIYLNDSHKSERTINRKLSSLKTYFKFLMKNEVVISNPLLKIQSLKVPERIVRDIKEDELTELFESNIFSDNFEGIRDKAILTTFYLCGIRREELISLKISDVDFHNMQIKVLGKGNKERIIPVTYIYIQLIEEYLESRKEIANGSLDFLFITSKAQKLNSRLVYTIVNRYLSKVSGVEKKSPHVLRHSFATHMLNKGADLNTIKELLGHSNLSATQIYTHASIENLKSVYNQTHPRGHKN